MNIDGSDQINLTNNPASDYWLEPPAWSPYIPPTKQIVQKPAKEYIPPIEPIVQELKTGVPPRRRGRFSIKLTLIKCKNSSCKAEYQMSEKKYDEAIQERIGPMSEKELYNAIQKRLNAMARTLPPLTCKKCGKDSVFRAVKCANSACGVIFFSDSVPNDFFDRCPECKQSETEEIRKKRRAGG